jgi:hypothetical protein
MKTHRERLEAIFREYPSIKASVDAGTIRIWIDDTGKEHWDLVSKRFSKRLNRIPIDDNQHEEIKARAKELADLIEEHPYLKQAIEDHWAKVVVQEDGNLGLEFTQGRSVHLQSFDETDGAAKALRTKENTVNRTKELTALIEKHAHLGTALRDGWVRLWVQDDGDLGLQFPDGDRASFSEFDEAASHVVKWSAGCAENALRERWVKAINNHRAEKVGRSYAEEGRRLDLTYEPLLSPNDVGF